MSTKDSVKSILQHLYLPNPPTEQRQIMQSYKRIVQKRKQQRVLLLNSRQKTA
jgi:hypothetical protein